MVDRFTNMGETIIDGMNLDADGKFFDSTQGKPLL